MLHLPPIAGPDRLLTEKQVAAATGIPVRTLQSWRARGSGPRVAHLGRLVRYPARDLAVWIERSKASQDALGDPVLAAIAAWRDAVRDFDARCPEREGPEADLLAAETTMPAIEALMAVPAATTRQGAAAALRFADEDLAETLGSDLARALLRAAIRYLEAS